jgi:hypothetical protein
MMAALGKVLQFGQERLQPCGALIATHVSNYPHPQVPHQVFGLGIADRFD